MTFISRFVYQIRGHNRYKNNFEDRGTAIPLNQGRKKRQRNKTKMVEKECFTTDKFTTSWPWDLGLISQPKDWRSRGSIQQPLDCKTNTIATGPRMLFSR